jgi:hypothetical protein
MASKFSGSNFLELATMILLFYYWLHVKRVNCYVYYDLFCYTGRFVYFGAIFMLKMKQKLRLRTTTGKLWHLNFLAPTFWNWRQNLIPGDFSGTNFFGARAAPYYRLDLFIKRHVSLKVNIYYSHMRKLILEPCA